MSQVVAWDCGRRLLISVHVVLNVPQVQGKSSELRYTLIDGRGGLCVGGTASVLGGTFLAFRIWEQVIAVMIEKGLPLVLVLLSRTGLGICPCRTQLGSFH